jgi:hypothetical protein
MDNPTFGRPMTQESPSRSVKWPLAIGGVSLLYGLIYGLVYVHPQSFASSKWSAMINVVIPTCFSAGGIGVVLRKPWGVTSLLWGSYLVFANAVYSFLVVCGFLGGVPPLFVLLGMLTLLSVLSAWPVFLVIWLRRRSGLTATVGTPMDSDQQSP